MESKLSIRKLRFFVTGITILISSIEGNESIATELPGYFNFQGQLLNDSGTAPLKEIVTLTFGIISPNGLCLLYEESHSGIDLILSEGGFSIGIGSPPNENVKRTRNDSGLEIAKIFSNSPLVLRADDFATTKTCPGGYTPSPQDDRRLRVTVTVSNGASVILSPDMKIGSVPMALVAQSAHTLNGIPPSGFIQTTTTGTQGAFNLLTAGTPTSDASSLHHHHSLYLRSNLDTPQSFGLGGLTTHGEIQISIQQL